MANKMVLIVDDNKEAVELLKDRLEFEGFVVETAHTGEDALIKARQFEPGVILLDVMMPEMDGLEVLTRLKKADATKNIPVIMLTAKSGFADMDKATALGADSYEVKPYNPERLLKKISKHISG
jgi:DNA-binding response OmpR family regulator